MTDISSSTALVGPRHALQSREELLAGLRKLGFESAATVKLAVLEEMGHVSAVGAAGAR